MPHGLESGQGALHSRQTGTHVVLRVPQTHGSLGQKRLALGPHYGLFGGISECYNLTKRKTKNEKYRCDNDQIIDDTHKQDSI